MLESSTGLSVLLTKEEEKEIAHKRSFSKLFYSMIGIISISY